MKKLLAILGAIGLTATGSASVIACSDKSASDTLFDGNFKIMEGQKISEILVNLLQTGVTYFGVASLVELTQIIALTAVTYDGNNINKPNESEMVVEKDKVVNITLSTAVAANASEDLQNKLTSKGYEINKEYNYDLTVEAKNDNKTDISQVQITWTAVSKAVTTPGGLTGDDVTTLITAVTAQIQTDLLAKIPGISASDYDLTGLEQKITANADFTSAQEVDFTITAKAESTLIANTLSGTINVTATQALVQ